MLRIGMCQDILDEIIAVLITGNINQRDAWSVETPFTDTVEIATEEVNSTNFETLFNNLGGKLIHTILGSIANNVINCPATIGRSAVLAYMLNAPITKLSMSNDINACENFFNTWALEECQ
jgi:hypothetical protein